MTFLSKVWKSVVTTYTTVFRIQELPTFCQYGWGVNEGGQWCCYCCPRAAKLKLKKNWFSALEKIFKLFSRWRERQKNLIFLSLQFLLDGGAVVTPDPLPQISNYTAVPVEYICVFRTVCKTKWHVHAHNQLDGFHIPDIVRGDLSL
jgi:hypothetical protein